MKKLKTIKKTINRKIDVVESKKFKGINRNELLNFNEVSNKYKSVISKWDNKMRISLIGW